MAHPSTAKPRGAAPMSARARKRGPQRRRSAGTPRVGVLCLVVAAASLFLPASNAAGAGLGPAATVKARKRAAGTVAERETSSIRSRARRPKDEHDDHDSRARVSAVSRRRRRYARPREEEEGGSSGYAAGSGSAGSRSRNTRGNSQGQRATPSSFDVLDSEEDEAGSSWGGTGTGSAGDGNHDSRGDPDDLDDSSSCENYDTEEGLYGEGTEDEEEDEEGDLVGIAPGGDGNSSEEDQLLSDSSEEQDSYISGHDGEGKDELSRHHRSESRQENPREQPGSQERGSDGDNSVEVCVMTWNLAEESPPARDVEFLRHASRGSDLVAIGVQEIENLKPRRNEGGRTREWRRLLVRTLGRDFVRVGHHAMGAVQLTLFARRELLDRVKVIKLSEVVCGVGNVLQNKGGIGAYLRVDRTTFLFVAAHLAAHQGKLEERNAGYWRIATTLNQEIPPAWVTHAARKRAKRAKAATAAAKAAAAAREESPAQGKQPPPSPPVVPWLPAVGRPRPPRGPFGDRVDRVFFFGDLNYRVDLSREDLELGVSVCRREQAVAAEEGDTGGQRKEKEARRRIGGRFRPGVTYPGTGALDALLDFDQLTLARSQGAAFGGFSEARVTFEPTYKYDKGSKRFDTSRKMRPPAWTDRILYSPSGPHTVSPLKYSSVPDSRHSDHRPVYAKFRVELGD